MASGTRASKNFIVNENDRNCTFAETRRFQIKFIVRHYSTITDERSSLRKILEDIRVSLRLRYSCRRGSKKFVRA